MFNTKTNQKTQLNSATNSLNYVRFPLEMLDLPWVTSADAVVYAFMLNRYHFFLGINKTYYENIDDIALGSRQSVATVKRTVKKLQEHDFIDITKVKSKIGCSNSYVIKDVFNVLAPLVKQKKKLQLDEDLYPDPFWGLAQIDTYLSVRMS